MTSSSSPRGGAAASAAVAARADEPSAGPAAGAHAASDRRALPTRWVIFGVLMLAALTINASQLKISAIAAQVSAAFEVSLTQTALLTSIFTVAGVVLSIPGTFVMRMIGIRRMFITLLGFLLAGNVIGAVAPSFELLMASRVIEGFSCSLILPLGLSLISVLFDDPEASLASGTFSAATPLANFVIMNAALWLVDATGSIRAVWWVLAACSIVCLVIVAILVKGVDGGSAGDIDGAAAESTAATPERPGALASLAKAYRNPALVLVCLAMLFLSFAVQGLVTCYAQIFVSYGLPESTANWYSSLNGLFGIAIGIVAGAVVGRVGKPYLTALVAGILGIACTWYVGHIVAGTYVLCVLGTAVTVGGVAMTSVFVLAPRLAGHPSYVPLATGLLNACFYLGSLISTPVLTALSGNGSSWTVPAYVLAASSALFALCVLASRALGGSELIAATAEPRK